MKKNYKTKRGMRLLITSMLMASLLIGCSSTEAETETETETAKPQVEAPVEEPAEIEEETPVEETKPEETETTEAGVETEAETTEEEPAEEVAEDPGEVTYITDYTSIEDYMGSLDPEKPAIVVYNAEEEYIINMQEGQYYQLKYTDTILYNFTDISRYTFNFMIVKSVITGGNMNYAICEEIDYEQMQPKHEFYLSKITDSGEEEKITCYLDPPTE